VAALASPCALKCGNQLVDLPSSSRIDTRSTFMIWNVKSHLVEQAVQLLLLRQFLGDLEQQRQLLLAPVLLIIGFDP